MLWMLSLADLKILILSSGGLQIRRDGTEWIPRVFSHEYSASQMSYLYMHESAAIF